MPIATTTTLTTVPETSASLGVLIQLDATITASNSSTPTGTVTFTDGSTTLATAPVDSNGLASANVNLGRGRHTLTAAFTGTPGVYSNSTGSASFFVSMGFNGGRVLLNRISPVQVVEARPGRLMLWMTASGALIGPDSTTPTTTGVFLHSFSEPLSLPNYDGAMWAVCPGPAFGISSGPDHATLFFLEMF